MAGYQMRGFRSAGSISLVSGGQRVSASFIHLHPKLLFPLPLTKALLCIRFIVPADSDVNYFDSSRTSCLHALILTLLSSTHLNEVLPMIVLSSGNIS